MQVWTETKETPWCEYDVDMVKAHKQLDTNQCILSTVAAGALMFKHQANSIHNADHIPITLDLFQAKKYIHSEQITNQITFWKTVNEPGA